VTREDYETLAGSYADALFGRVALAQAISTRSADQDLTLGNQLSVLRNEINFPKDYAGVTSGVIAPATLPSEADGVYMADARARLSTISAETAGITADATAAAASNNSSSGDLVAMLSAARTLRNASLQVNSDAQDASLDLSTVLNDATFGINNLPTSSADSLTTSTKTLLQSKLTSTLTDSTKGIENITIAGSDQLTSATADFLSTLVRDAISVINGISTTGASQLTTADRNSLIAKLNDANAKQTAMLAASATITAQVNSQIIGTINTLQDRITSLGVDVVTTGTTLKSILDHVANISSQVGNTSGLPAVPLIVTQRDPLTGVTHSFTYPLTVGSLVSDLETIQGALVDQTGIVSTACDAIFDHVDSLLAADCQSNLVTVPILSKDAAGFFAPPSNGLIQALQTYLDNRKEVTQTVSVVSGKNSLVYAVLTVRVGYKNGFSQSVIKTSVQAAVDNVLRDRKFGQSLYLSELWDAVDAINGVAFTNVTINGHLTDAQDPNSLSALLLDQGNLIIGDSQVITKGLVTVLSPELAP
jgi:hypothetical protein